MGKFKLGHDQRGHKSLMMKPKPEQVQQITVEIPELDIQAALEEYFAANPLPEVKEAPLATMLPSCGSRQCSEPQILEQKVVERIETIKEISKRDERARRHSVATRNELHKIINRKQGLLNRAMDIQRKATEEIKAKVSALEMRKPEEKQVVIEKTEVQSKSHPLVIGGLVVSLLLNILILISK